MGTATNCPVCGGSLNGAYGRDRHARFTAAEMADLDLLLTHLQKEAKRLQPGTLHDGIGMFSGRKPLFTQEGRDAERQLQIIEKIISAAKLL